MLRVGCLTGPKFSKGLFPYLSYGPKEKYGLIGYNVSTYAMTVVEMVRQGREYERLR
jgi:hypothetical protein